MRIPKAMNEFIPAKLQGGTLVHAKHIGHNKALCGRTITNWLESPGTPEWYLCPDATELTCPQCIKICGEQNVESTPNDVETSNSSTRWRAKSTTIGETMCRVYLVVKGTGKARTLVSIKPTVEQSVANLLAQKPSEDHFLTEYDFGAPNPHLPEHICQEVERKRI